MPKHEMGVIRKILLGLLGACIAFVGVIFALIYAVSTGISIAAIGGKYLSILVIVVMTPWDFLVWLFNADWRTTNFEAPLFALVALIAFSILEYVFGHAGVWTGKAKNWCNENKYLN